MSRNQELATIFAQMGDVLDLLGENAFKINAHRRVARALEDMAEDAAALAVSDPDALRAMPGFGAATVKKIKEFAELGKVPEHQELLAQVPAGLLQVLQIPGLGPKRVRALWQDGGVVDVASLKAKIADGSLAKLKGMGAKTLQNALESLEYLERSAGRARLGQAMPVAEALVAFLQRVKGVKHIGYAGSLRRGRETIGDVDIVASARYPAHVHQALQEAPGVTKVLAAGETKTSVRMDTGLQVDLRTVSDAEYGAALLYFTGSKEHNIRLRERAQQRGLRLNEYGLFPDDGEAAPQDRGINPIAAATEEDVYAALELPWIPPELREDHGELGSPPPKGLVSIADIKADLHSHTNASDGALTIEGMADEAIRRGLKVLAITDHSRSSAQANGLTTERLLDHISLIRSIARQYKDQITLLAGSEVDILADGSLDYPDEILAQLDVVVASPHSSLKAAPEVATERLLKAIRHPLVHIIGHPTGRIINAREGLSPDIALLARESKAHNTALEINANTMRLDLRDAHVRVCVDTGTLISINTDAHAAADFDQLRYGVTTARRGWLTTSLCVNAWEPKALLDWLKSKRPG
ncbi:MAG: DNA polymerase/3'-5' exonuclease PolX [Phycisphaerae bacterium]|nr:DNA polymerase/3'-5' exonuclease PolX [Phycisphaerae bacterium]